MVHVCTVKWYCIFTLILQNKHLVIFTATHCLRLPSVVTITMSCNVALHAWITSHFNSRISSGANIFRLDTDSLHGLSTDFMQPWLLLNSKLLILSLSLFNCFFNLFKTAKPLNPKRVTHMFWFCYQPDVVVYSESLYQIAREMNVMKAFVFVLPLNGNFIQPLRATI